MRPVVLRLLPDEHAICRLPAGTPGPAWSRGGAFTSVTATPDEVSVICAAAHVPEGVDHDRGWRVAQFEGPIALTEIGVLTSVLVPLAAAGASILAQSTFNTDYLLLKSVQLEVVVDALRAAGHVVNDA